MATEQFRLLPSFVPRQGVGIMVIFVRPGPVGVWNHEDSDFPQSDPYALSGSHHGAHGLTGINPDAISAPFWSDHFGPDREHRQLAALAYGEASSQIDIPEEMAAIANTAVRYMRESKFATVDELRTKKPGYADAMTDHHGYGNPRYNKLLKSSFSAIMRDSQMSWALWAAENALEYWGHDYSNGAFFWQGRDLVNQFREHRGNVYPYGLKFTNPKHNIFGLTEHKRESKETQNKNKYEYAYETTAAWGNTIFLRHTKEWLKIPGNSNIN
jgi:hypothetical protein